jgi:signal transduction histidine kinase
MAIDQMGTNQNLISVHKFGNTKFVAPVLVANFTIVALLSFNWSKDYAIGLFLTCLAFALNITFVKLNPSASYIRNDVVDSTRWLINILFIDVAAAVHFHLSLELMFCFWMTVIIGAFIEVYDLKLRLLVTSVGILSGLYCIYHDFPNSGPASEFIFVTTVAAVLVFIYAMEMNWMRESELRVLAQNRETELIVQSEGLFKTALTGQNAGIIAHEVDNMITAINFATNNPREVDLNKINVSLNYVKQACDLILKENDACVHQITVKQLIDDVQLLIRKQVLVSGIEWNVDCPSELDHARFAERIGSCYFILQNFITNAVQSIQRAGSRGKILLKVESRDQMLLVSVFDNGTGMTSDVRAQVLSGFGNHLEFRNRGIGMKFVLMESKRNGYDVFMEGIDKHQSEFKTVVGIKIPKINTKTNLN